MNLSQLPISSCLRIKDSLYDTLLTFVFFFRHWNHCPEIYCEIYITELRSIFHSYRNHSTDLQSKSMDWFLYESSIEMGYDNSFPQKHLSSGSIWFTSNHLLSPIQLIFSFFWIKFTMSEWHVLETPKFTYIYTLVIYTVKLVYSVSGYLHFLHLQFSFFANPNCPKDFVFAHVQMHHLHQCIKGK